MAWIIELGAFARDSEMCQANIDADGFTFDRYLGGCYIVVGKNGGMKLAAGIAANGDGLDASDDFAMDDAFGPADFRQIDTVSIKFDALRILK